MGIAEIIDLDQSAALEEWRAAGRFPPEDIQRGDYLEDVEDVLQPGLSKNDIQHLLGPADDVFPDEWLYIIRPHPYLRWETELLVLSFDDEENLTSHRIEFSEVYARP